MTMKKITVPFILTLLFSLLLLGCTSSSDDSSNSKSAAPESSGVQLKNTMQFYLLTISEATEKQQVEGDLDAFEAFLVKKEITTVDELNEAFGDAQFVNEVNAFLAEKASLGTRGSGRAIGTFWDSIKGWLEFVTKNFSGMVSNIIAYLTGQGGSTALKINSAIRASVSSIVAGQATAVTFEVDIQGTPISAELWQLNEAGAPIRQLSSLADGGSNGDTKASDGTYSGAVSFNEAQQGVIIVQAIVKGTSEQGTLASKEFFLSVTSNSGIAQSYLLCRDPGDPSTTGDSTVYCNAKTQGCNDLKDPQIGEYNDLAACSRSCRDLVGLTVKNSSSADEVIARCVVGSDSGTTPGSGGIVDGQVVDSLNQAIKGVIATVDLKGIAYQATTAEDGRFSLTIPEAQRKEGYNVQFFKEGYELASQPAVFDLENLKVALGVIVLKVSSIGNKNTRVISGKVVDASTQSSLGEVLITVTDAKSNLRVTSTNAEGNFTMSGEAFELNATYTLNLTKTGYERRNDVSITISGVSNSVIPVITLTQQTGTTLTGTVEDSSNALLLGEIQVKVTDAQSLEQSAVTDASGNFSVAGNFTNGSSYTLAFEGTGYTSGTSQVSITNDGGANALGSPVKLVPVAESPLKTIIGQVLNSSSSAPVVGAQVTIRDAKGNLLKESSSNASGSFYLVSSNLLKETTYSLEANAAGYYTASTTVTIPSGAVYNIPEFISLVSTDTIFSITGEVVDGLGSAGLKGVKVTLQDSKLTTQFGVTGEDGAFKLTSSNFKKDSSYVLTLEKEGYVTRSDVLVTIKEENNEIDGGTAHLFKHVGSITGMVQDDAGVVLSGVEVSTLDTAGETISGSTDNSGSFTLESDFFFLGQKYGLSFSKANYYSLSADAEIVIPSANRITTVQLTMKATISGSVADSKTNAALAGVTVAALNASNQEVTQAQTGSDGKFTLDHTGLVRNKSYKIKIQKSDYLSQEVTYPVSGKSLTPGDNLMNSVLLVSVLPGPVTIRGKVVDYWKNSAGIAAASIAGASVSILDEEGVVRETTTGSTGDFEVHGTFALNKSYDLKVSKTGYTGENDVFITTIKGTTTELDAGIYNLYPVGIFVTYQRCKNDVCDDVLSKSFEFRKQQSYENFLTGKIGFTLTLRDTETIAAADSFYLHLDDTSFPPTLPSGSKISNYVAVGGGAVRGVLGEQLGQESREVLWNVKDFVMYHFYASQTGSYSIDLSDLSNTEMKLYNYAGTELSHQDGKTDFDSKRVHSITPNASDPSKNWYFVRVRGRTNSVYGFYNLKVLGPALSNQLGSLPQTYDVTNTEKGGVISWFDQTNNRLYIAAPNENTSSGSIKIDQFGSVGGLVRSTNFSGTLRAVDTTGDTAKIVKGYFNIIRSE
ncbi:carboxypeptidase-like regulatory domain-containing protein [Deltaproteobacteria bacterium TL4]